VVGMSALSLGKRVPDRGRSIPCSPVFPDIVESPVCPSSAASIPRGRARVENGRQLRRVGKDGDEREGGSASAGSIEDVKARRRRMTAQRNMELVYKVYRVFTESLDVEEKLEKTLDFIFDLLLRIDRGKIIIVDGKTAALKEAASKCRRGAEGVKYSNGVVGWVLRHKEAFMVSDSDIEGQKMPGRLKLMSIKSVMCLPLISSSRLIGVFYLDSVSRPYGFRGEDLHLMRALSAPIAMAVENAALSTKRKPSKHIWRSPGTAQGSET
jgi:transcriptional regulator with GAF, ATPase, and Fis domain